MDPTGPLKWTSRFSRKILAKIPNLEKNVRSLKEDDPGKAYQVMKKLRSQPGDCSDEGAFTLISHIDENLTIEESMEKIANHFSKISQEFSPLNPNLLPETVQDKINATNIHE